MGRVRKFAGVDGGRNAGSLGGGDTLRESDPARRVFFRQVSSDVDSSCLREIVNALSKLPEDLLPDTGNDVLPNTEDTKSKEVFPESYELCPDLVVLTRRLLQPAMKNWKSCHSELDIPLDFDLDEVCNFVSWLVCRGSVTFFFSLCVDLGVGYLFASECKRYVSSRRYAQDEPQFWVSWYLVWVLIRRQVLVESDMSCGVFRSFLLVVLISIRVLRSPLYLLLSTMVSSLLIMACI